MMKFSVCLIVVLLIISHFTVHSVPIRDMVEEQPVKVTKRETNSDMENLDNDLNGFSHELTNAPLPKYLKDLYFNFSLPNGPDHPFKNHKIIAANTIRSYKNQAAHSKLHL